MRESIRKNRVLVVVDDVEDMEQLNSVGLDFSCSVGRKQDNHYMQKHAFVKAAWSRKYIFTEKLDCGEFPIF